MRAVVARGRALLVRDGLPALVVFARAPPTLPPEDLRVLLDRLEPELADLARLVPDLRAPDAAAPEPAAFLRELAAFVREPAAFVRDPPVFVRELDLDAEDLERAAADLRAPLVREDERVEPEPEPLLVELSSAVHLPDITRCAASATASAISEPNLVALATTLLAACVAVSAASSPASRIARRAFGLALIAAAAAARPAASISLLIAALVSLSTVSLPPEEEPLREDLAIASSPSVGEKTLQPSNGSQVK